MSKQLFIFAAFSIFGMGACHTQVKQPVIELNTKQQLGYLQHRGRQYDIRDLMDPAFRAASTDDFVRNFEPHSAFVNGPAFDATAGFSVLIIERDPISSR